MEKKYEREGLPASLAKRASGGGDDGDGVYWLGAICFALHVIEDDLISPSCRRTRVNNLLCVLALVLSADCTS